MRAVRGQASTSQSATGSTLSARVREVGASADPVTRTFTVKVALESAEQLPLGTTVTVVPKALDRSGTQVIKLPTSALFRHGSGSAVWLLDAAASSVKLQPIQVATADGNEAVISAGLKPGDRVAHRVAHVLLHVHHQVADARVGREHLAADVGVQVRDDLVDVAQHAGDVGDEHEGGGVDEREMITRFLGRAPNHDAYLAYIKGEQ